MKYRVVEIEHLRNHARIVSLYTGEPGGIVGLVVENMRPGGIIDVHNLGHADCRVTVDGVTFVWTAQGTWREV